MTTVQTVSTLQLTTVENVIPTDKIDPTTFAVVIIVVVTIGIVVLLTGVIFLIGGFIKHRRVRMVRYQLQQGHNRYKDMYKIVPSPPQPLFFFP